jgi:hypothetical protein
MRRVTIEISEQAWHRIGDMAWAEDRDVENQISYLLDLVTRDPWPFIVRREPDPEDFPC